MNRRGPVNYNGALSVRQRGNEDRKYTSGLTLCGRCKCSAAHTTVHTLTVREVKVMHIPPKPLKVRAMKIRTESSANDIHDSS